MQSRIRNVVIVFVAFSFLSACRSQRSCASATSAPLVEKCDHNLTVQCPATDCLCENSVLEFLVGSEPPWGVYNRVNTDSGIESLLGIWKFEHVVTMFDLVDDDENPLQDEDGNIVEKIAMNDELHLFPNGKNNHSFKLLRWGRNEQSCQIAGVIHYLDEKKLVLDTGELSEIYIPLFEKYLNGPSCQILVEFTEQSAIISGVWPDTCDMPYCSMEIGTVEWGGDFKFVERNDSLSQKFNFYEDYNVEN